MSKKLAYGLSLASRALARAAERRANTGSARGCRTTSSGYRKLSEKSFEQMSKKLTNGSSSASRALVSYVQQDNCF
jgi:hypothetical protein